MNFYFIDVTLFCFFDQQVYPAEIALAKFSLRQGVHQTLQFAINPGKLPIGAGSGALEKSIKEHRYSLPKFDEEDKTDYYDLLEKILGFIDGDELPIFYCQNELNTNEKKVQLTLNKILHETCENAMLEHLKIYPVEHLLFHLHVKITEMKKSEEENPTKKRKLVEMPSKVFAEREFKNYCMANGCDYHAEKDATRFCALTKVRGFGYILAEYCCDFDQYPKIPEQHHMQLKPSHPPEDY